MTFIENTEPDTSSTHANPAQGTACDGTYTVPTGITSINGWFL